MSLKPHKQVRLARRLLDQHYDAPITIEDLSREVFLSPYYLIRAFRHVYKQTPHQYLVAQRIARAKELLRNSDLSITEICADVGFESLGSFSTLFRKVAGISPSAYRVSCNPIFLPLTFLFVSVYSTVSMMSQIFKREQFSRSQNSTNVLCLRYIHLQEIDHDQQTFGRNHLGQESE